MPRIVAMVALGGMLAAGCGSHHFAPRLFAITTVYYERGDFEGAALLRVEPKTLAPIGRPLRLGDAVTSRALSGDGHTLAFGGYNFGEILFVDVSRPRRVRRLDVVHDIALDTAIEVEGWRSPSRLIAVATLGGAWWGPHPSTLLIVDPTRARVVRRTSLGGTVVASVSVRDGTVALLVLSGRFPRLLVVRPDGSTWSRSLRRLDLGGRDRVVVAGTSYPARRQPALASDGRGRVFVIATDRPIAELRLHARELRYHRVALLRRYFAYPPPAEPGTGGVHLTYAATAAWLGNGRLAVGGSDEIPARIRGYGVGHRLAQRKLQIVDPRSWRRERVLPATDCERAQGVTLCHSSVGRDAPDGKGSRGASLVAYDARWRILYEKRRPAVWWVVTAGRLFAGSPDGSRVVELQPSTGRVLTRLASRVPNRMWPLDLVAWKPRR